MGANTAQEMNVMNELYSLSAQIGGSLQVPLQYGQPTTVYANPTPGYYNNWRSQLANENRAAGEARILQMDRDHQDRVLEQKYVNNAVHHEQVEQVQANQAYNAELNNLKTAEEKAAWRRAHPNYVGH